MLPNRLQAGRRRGEGELELNGREPAESALAAAAVVGVFDPEDELVAKLGAGVPAAPVWPRAASMRCSARRRNCNSRPCTRHATASSARSPHPRSTRSDRDAGGSSRCATTSCPTSNDATSPAAASSSSSSPPRSVPDRGRVHDQVAGIQQQWRDLLHREARAALDQGELPTGVDPAQLAYELGVILDPTDLVAVREQRTQTGPNRIRARPLGLTSEPTPPSRTSRPTPRSCRGHSPEGGYGPR